MNFRRDIGQMYMPWAMIDIEHDSCTFKGLDANALLLKCLRLVLLISLKLSPLSIKINWNCVTLNIMCFSREYLKVLWQGPIIILVAFSPKHFRWLTTSIGKYFWKWDTHPLLLKSMLFWIQHIFQIAPMYPSKRFMQQQRMILTCLTIWNCYTMRLCMAAARMSRPASEIELLIFVVL